MAENEIAVVKRELEEYPERRAYIEGIKYYLRRIKSRKGIVHDRDLYQHVQKFNEALKLFEKSDTDGELYEMDAIFDTFYPEGQIDKRLDQMNLNLAFDSISEYLMRLKKMYRIGSK